MAGEPERIEFARSGGFANIPVRAEVAADALDPHERRPAPPIATSTTSR